MIYSTILELDPFCLVQPQMLSLGDKIYFTAMKAVAFRFNLSNLCLCVSPAFVSSMFNCEYFQV